ncbi:serine hydrolase [Brevundimonas pondensis]|uniref:serine hydrolase n=1 Tax=Brevundimonas pondensis TaxID=2774189 RepID=UPI00320B0982
MRPVICITLAACLLTGLASTAVAQSRVAIDLEPAFAKIAQTGPGCVAGVRRPGAPDQIFARGQSDLEHADPLTADSIIETGSLAKQFTAAAIMLLVEDGKASLDDDIRRYLPEMPDYGVPITLRHLLNHTSGLREQWSLLALTGNGPGAQVHSMPLIFELASRQKGLNFKPGDEFFYTNTNYALAAMIVERISGVSLQQFTDERLFQPLGMSHTRWREDFRTVVPGRATAYAPTETGFIANMPFTNVYGNGGMLTTVGDLLRWNAFLDQPSALAGGPVLAAALQAPGSLNDGTALEYGLGLELAPDQGRRLVAHSGSTGGYKTWLARYPDQGVSIAVLCNNGGINPIAMGEQIAELVLPAAGTASSAEGAAATAAVQTSNVDLTPYPGLFRNPVTGALVQVEAADGQLTLKQGGVRALAALGEDRFQAPDGEPVRFARTNARATELILSQGRFLAVPPAASDPAALSAYVGTYYSPELDTRISLIQRGDGLVVRQPFAVEWPLSPSFADGFTARLRGSTTFVFERDADGDVTGVRAWANGVRGLLFSKQ